MSEGQGVMPQCSETTTVPDQHLSNLVGIYLMAGDHRDHWTCVTAKPHDT